MDTVKTIHVWQSYKYQRNYKENRCAILTEEAKEHYYKESEKKMLSSLLSLQFRGCSVGVFKQY